MLFWGSFPGSWWFFDGHVFQFSLPLCHFVVAVVSLGVDSDRYVSTTTTTVTAVVRLPDSELLPALFFC